MQRDGSWSGEGANWGKKVQASESGLGSLHPGKPVQKSPQVEFREENGEQISGGKEGKTSEVRRKEQKRRGVCASLSFV